MVIVIGLAVYPSIRTKFFVYDDEFLKEIIDTDPKRINEVLTRPDTRFFKNKTTAKHASYAISNVDPDILTNIQPFISKGIEDRDEAFTEAVRALNAPAVERLIYDNANTSGAFETLRVILKAHRDAKWRSPAPEVLEKIKNRQDKVHKVVDILLKHAPLDEIKRWFFINYRECDGLTVDQYATILDTMLTDNDLYDNLSGVIKDFEYVYRGSDLLDLARPYVRQFYQRALTYTHELILLVAENQDKGIIKWHIDTDQENSVTSQVLACFTVDILNEQDENGCTTILYAARQKNLAYVKALLEIDGIDIKKKDNDKNTLLHYPYVAIQKVLLPKKGIGKRDLNAKNESGQTPLHVAVLYNYKDSITLLLSYGADPQIKDAHGRTPIDIAQTLNVSQT